jgi:hypothetical protein
VELKSAREVRLRAWTRSELSEALAAAGFDLRGAYGDMVGGEYDRESSVDLVMVAVLRAPTV